MRSLLACLFLTAAAVGAQPPGRQPAFETATIKMTDAKGGGGHSRENDAPGLFRGSMTLKSYIMTAYNVKDFQVTGGPNWIDATSYEILGNLEHTADVPPENTVSTRRAGTGPDEEQLHIALQSLLADRFQLKFHHESKEMPAYALTAVKGKFKLLPAPENGGCGTRSSGDGNGHKLTATCVDMKRFANFLARVLRQPVFDQTAIEGLYSFGLQWTNDDAVSGGGSSQLDSLFLEHCATNWAFASNRRKRRWISSWSIERSGPATTDYSAIVDPTRPKWSAVSLHRLVYRKVETAGIAQAANGLWMPNPASGSHFTVTALRASRCQRGPVSAPRRITDLPEEPVALPDNAESLSRANSETARQIGGLAINSA